MFRKRIAKINARKAEIRKLLETDKNADLDALTKELRDLDEEMQDIERRSAIIGGLDDGQPSDIDNPLISDRNGGEGEPVFTRDNVLATTEYRTAWAKTLMHRSLSDVEKRALDTAITTTATTYTAPTASVDGVNNGGLFIPTDINLALMNALGLVSPMFRDAAKTAVPGLLKFPYKKTASKAKNVKETAKTPDGSVEWAELSLGMTEIAETIRVSWRLEAMAVEEFISYITAELIEQVQDTAITQLIYGSGTDEMRGVNLDAVKHQYTGGVLDAVGAALKLLTPKLKIGAKIYLSQSAVEEICFMKDANGNYIHNPINGVGINSIAGYAVEVEPYLNNDDFVIGNIGRYYRMNTVEALSLARDTSGKNRANDYTAYTIVAGAAQPNTLVYASKKTTSG